MSEDKNEVPVRVVDLTSDKTIEELLKEFPPGGYKEGELVLITGRQGRGKSLLWEQYVEELKKAGLTGEEVKELGRQKIGRSALWELHEEELSKLNKGDE